MRKNKKPKYLRPLSLLKDGYLTIPLGVEQLVDASNALINNESYAQSLSLSVIALEECGKLFLLDSLLFVRNKENDHYKKSAISHKNKLDAFQFLISLLMIVSKFDEKFLNARTRERFSKAVTIGLFNLHEDYKNLRDTLPSNDIVQLDTFKQMGFYSSHLNQKFCIPSLVLDKELCLSTNKLANSFSTNMNFLLNKVAVENYIRNAKNIRSKMDENDWSKIDLATKAEVESLLGNVMVPEVH